ncbi:hypothetical protein CBL21_21980 [Shigella flexneri]|nr:hypothetical protein CBL21_21980 [Shigella flexneri]
MSPTTTCQALGDGPEAFTNALTHWSYASVLVNFRRLTTGRTAVAEPVPILTVVAASATTNTLPRISKSCEPPRESWRLNFLRKR